MKKIHRRIFGILGLVLVAIMTFFAAAMPAPDAAAATTKLQVRVNRNIPDVTITDAPTSVVSGEPTPIIVTDNEQSITFTYEKVDTVTITLYHDNGGTFEVVYTDSFSANYNPGERTVNLDLDDYGYGDYIFTVKGTGDLGSDEDSVAFTYVPIELEVNQSGEDADPVATYEYDKDKTDHAKISITTDDGTPISALTNLDAPDSFTLTLPFEENNLEEGYYKATLYTYTASGNLIGKVTVRFYYDRSDSPTVPDTGDDDEKDDDDDNKDDGGNPSGSTDNGGYPSVPDTGFLTKLNISHADYAATGCIVFFIATLLGLCYIKKHSKRR